MRTSQSYQEKSECPFVFSNQKIKYKLLEFSSQPRCQGVSMDKENLEKFTSLQKPFYKSDKQAISKQITSSTSLQKGLSSITSSTMTRKSVDLSESKKIQNSVQNNGPMSSAGLLSKQFQEQKDKENLQNLASQGHKHRKSEFMGSSMDFMAESGNSCVNKGKDDQLGNSRRFSMFSKSSFATQSSFMFGTRIYNKSMSMAQSKSVPRVAISSIFKNKAFLYLDEELISTFDDLLEKGHEIVTAKKEERDILKATEVAMAAEAQDLEKEIIPLVQRTQQCSQQIEHQINLQNQYEKEICLLKDEMAWLNSQIINRQREVCKDHDEMTEKIKQMEILNNQIKSDININKACHRQEANSQTQHKRQQDGILNGLTSNLIQYKAEYEQKKLAQADKLRKMENKQKMFMGILKH